MSFQQPNDRPKDPALSHYTLVKTGPKLVGIKSAPKWVKNNSLCVIEVSVDGVKHVYFTDNQQIASKFAQFVGKQVVLIASGNSKQKTDSMEIQEAGSVPQRQVTQKPASSSDNTPKVETPKSEPPKISSEDIQAKRYLCQAANLMRLCVKKANDISVEMGLPNEHRQGMATTFFIQCDRRGLIDSMPISPYSPEELGYGSSKAVNLAQAQPNDNEDI